MLEQARDFAAECSSLNELLSGLSDARWNEPTQFKGWTANDIIGHLHIFDYAANLTLDSTDAVREFFAASREGRSETWTLRDFTRQWLGGMGGSALRDRWYRFALQLAARYELEDPVRRVAWGGPDMSTRSCITARQMETWSHGQALFDLMGVERVESDRLRNIAILGINTFGWTFANRGQEIPTTKPFVRLIAPSGEIWQWNELSTSECITGTAVDFCRVVTQTRNVADTALTVGGDIARRWMAIAQCFAGPAHDAPAPGTRHRVSA